MMSLRVVRPRLFSASSSSSYSQSRQHLSLCCSLPSTAATKPFSSITSKDMNKGVIEHIVLFKVKDDTDPTKITTMLNALNALVSLDQVLHLTTGPILRNRSSPPFNFTHMLHSRYETKQNLADYSAHPSHLSVVKESVLPICDDIMAVDWVSSLAIKNIVVSSGSAMRVQFLKLKEEEEGKGKVLGVIGGIKEKLGDLIDEISFGENFSPARAKGFSIASIGVFKGLNELDAVDVKEGEDAIKEEKGKVKDLLESVIVVDFVVPSLPPKSANL